MNIAKYGAYFHDASLIDVHHAGTHIIFSMWSAEMDPEDMEDDIPLSDLRIKGRLHVEGVKEIRIDEKQFSGILKMFYDSGEIFHLEIEKNKMEIQIIWQQWLPKPINEVGFSTIQIEAEKIYWEPVPDLVDPF